MKTQKYVCYDEAGRIVAIIFTDKVDITVRGGAFSKWELNLYAKDHLYIGAIECEDYEIKETGFYD